MKTIRRKRPEWSHLGYDKLLDLRFRDLKLKLVDTPLMDRVQQLYDELERKDIHFKPHCWLAEEWFSPDGIPGIAIPFYLAHPKLAKLEAMQMYEVEGGSESWCSRLLRHEAGHAISTAYQLHRRKRFKQLFGNYNKPYPESYQPNPKSKNYVMHLAWWYAQCHPAEDFAETFAVWLKPKSNWRTKYKDWPVIRKLEYMDELMGSIASKPVLNSKRNYLDPVSQLNKTLREHYQEKRRYYSIDIPNVYDGELMQLFPTLTNYQGRFRSAATFLKKYQAELCKICSRGTGESAYVIAQILQEMMVRCREMRLPVCRSEAELKIDVAIFVALQSLNYRQKINYRIAV
jgi:hypothetical protein